LAAVGLLDNLELLEVREEAVALHHKLLLVVVLVEVH
jgi:hypothetical protein